MMFWSSRRLSHRVRSSWGVNVLFTDHDPFLSGQRPNIDILPLYERIVLIASIVFCVEGTLFDYTPKKGHIAKTHFAMCPFPRGDPSV
jgi:hypothetical protein